MIMRLKLNKSVWYRIELGAGAALCFLIGFAFGQGSANSSYLYWQREEVITDLCRRSMTPECRKARASLTEFPVQATAHD